MVVLQGKATFRHDATDCILHNSENPTELLFFFYKRAQAPMHSLQHWMATSKDYSILLCLRHATCANQYMK